MPEEVITISPTAELAAAARLMTENRIGCLPVLDDGNLVGILTESDLVASIARGGLPDRVPI